MTQVKKSIKEMLTIFRGKKARIAGGRTFVLYVQECIYFILIHKVIIKLV